MKAFLDRYALPAACVVAWVAMAGSLYLSEVLLLTPCRLCWFQRIAMYPLSIILLVAALRRDYGVYRYVLPLSIIGGLIAAYHYSLQKTTLWSALAPCSLDNPCSAVQINWLGFVTIPLMSFVAFSIITFLMWYIRKQYEHGK